VEAVSPDFIFFVKFLRERIKISVLRHCLMKSSVKHENLRRIGHGFAAAFDTHQMRARMERG
jgi:hypothetical protein